MNIQEEIANWSKVMLNPTSNDLLVDISEFKKVYLLNDKTVGVLTFEGLLKKIVLEAQKVKRNLGISPFCIIDTVLDWTYKNKEIKTPLFLHPANFKINRFKNELRIDLEEEFIFNPYLSKILEVEQLNKSKEELIKEITEKDFDKNFLALNGIANIHHHRFTIVKELEELSALSLNNSTLNSLLNYGFRDGYELKLDKGFLFNADIDQQEVFNKSEKENLVIQGPPGTGKSQVITNLLTKAIAKNNKTALVSEKAAALSVIYEKLKAYSLHHFCSFYNGLKSNTKNIQGLKNTWQYLESLEPNSVNNLRLSEQVLQGLQLKFDRLNATELVNGLDYATFKAQCVNYDFNGCTFEVLNTDLNDWIKAKPFIEVLLNNKELSTITTWTKIKRLKDYSINDFEALALTVKALKRKISKEFKFSNIDLIIKQSLLAQLFFYDGNALNKELLLKESVIQKRFLKLSNQFTSLSEQMILIEKEKEHWNKEFSSSEISDYIKALSDTRFLSFKAKRKRKELEKYSNINFEDYAKSLENLNQFYQIKNKLIACKEKLRKLGVTPNKATLSLINLIINKANNYNANTIQEIAQLKENERLDLIEKGKIITELKKDLSKFSDLENENLVQFFSSILELIPVLIKVHKNLKVEDEFLNLIVKYKTVENIEKHVFYAAKVKFEGLNPDLAEFSGEYLKNKLAHIKALKQEEQHLFAAQIKQEIKQKFEAYHTLLQTPAQKLDDAAKALKKELRVGKSILIKEFAKTRSYKSPSELNKTEAKFWIDLLQPIKLLNPYQMASDYSLEQAMFDLVVFDEASQIPLANAFGAVYRAKRFVVAGDEQQMAPTTYFKAEANTTDLLHQASYNLSKVGLTYHYRSSHPKLIAFSNKYFYNNALNAFPSSLNNSPIELVNVAGVYTEKGNIKEAKKVAEYIEDKLNKANFDFGVVAFNEKQLKLIKKQLSEVKQIELEEAIEKGVLFKSLENVQGDECAHLIISLGFGFDENDKFDMRFGPVNKENGHRRLNVLFSRAKDKITFVCSVKSSNFKLSDNPGVDLLRKYLVQLENDSFNEMNLPFNLTYRREKEKLTFINIYNQLKNVNQLYTFYNVMSNRAWDIQFKA